MRKSCAGTRHESNAIDQCQDWCRSTIYATPDGDHGAVYVWQNQEALNRFRDSVLARTIAETYRVQRAAETITADVVLTLSGRRIS